MRRLLALCIAFGLSGGPVLADDLIGSYTAFIGQDDLYNSKGVRLTAPWQVLRQDRANVHRFGISQPGDESDPFFANAANRAALERMVSEGTISRSAGQAIVKGGVMVVVRVYGRGGIGRYVDVSVVR